MSDKISVLAYVSQQKQSVSMGNFKDAVSFSVSDRTVRRWLNDAAEKGKVLIQGEKRTTTYISTSKGKGNSPFQFLQNKTPALQEQTLKLLRDF